MNKMIKARDSGRLRMLANEIIECRRCNRLITFYQQISKTKKKAYRGEIYWGKPVPSFGSFAAELLIIGLAPAAHGGNRTGRLFTGDASGDFLFDALFRFGFSNQPGSLHAQDGLKLINTYLTAVIHCAPPGNKPLPEEIQNCQSYLREELESLSNLRAVLVLGNIAFKEYIQLLKKTGRIEKKLKLKFVHGGMFSLGIQLPVLFSSYHPSQQNTRTGRLTPKMFDDLLTQIRQFLSKG